VCDRFVPRWPHLIVLSVLGLMILVGLIVIVEYLATAR
jgi:hypothetical protein